MHRWTRILQKNQECTKAEQSGHAELSKVHAKYHNRSQIELQSDKPPKTWVCAQGQACRNTK